MSESKYQVRRSHRDEFIKLRGLSHHLLRWGEPRDGQPLLVMAHGWMDVGASFQFVVDALSEAREVLAFDWRGFGLTAPSGSDSYWFPDYLGDLDALLDAVSPDAPVDLLGHSMGGNIVMSYAGLRPQRVHRLINLEGFGLPDTRAEEAPRRMTQWLDELKTPASLKPYASLAEVAARLCKTNPRLCADKALWLAGHWSRETAPGRFELLADPGHKRANPVPYRWAEVEAHWRAIRAPLLWMEGAATPFPAFWGERFPMRELERRRSIVPQTRLITLADAGHMLHHDQPQPLAQSLEAFLSAAQA
ncbi:MAG: alpha/beta hydrolase [Paucibacter sp.]|nr:alpha/beta hydrolase [Roseateles sp.]